MDNGAGGTRADDPDPCVGVTCDDGNECTADVCEPETGSCVHRALVTNGCRPRIDVEFPPRGSTLLGIGSDPTVVVSGTVGSSLGNIESLTVNGRAVEVDDDGRFAERVDVEVGGNKLKLVAVDQSGNARSRVQSFLWSTGYRKPTTPKTGIAFDALGIWLAQAVLDDGRPAPPTDFAHVMNLVLQEQELGALVDADTPVAEQAGYQIYVTSVEVGGSQVELETVDRAIALRITLSDVRGDLRFDCTTFGCLLLGGDSSGSYSLGSVVVESAAALRLTLRRQLSVELRDTRTTIDGLEVRSNNGFTDFLLGIVERFVIDSLVDSLEAELTDTFSRELEPLLEDGLSELAFDLAVDLPKLLGDGSVTIDLLTDFQAIDLRGASPQGGLFVERAGAYLRGVATEQDDDGLGVPLRERCGRGRAIVAPPRRSAIELALSDDLLNQVLYAAWRGGWLEVEVGSELLGGVDLLNLGVTDLELGARGLLTPTISDCNPEGLLRAHLGDLRIDGRLTLEEEPLTFTAFATLVTDVEVGIVDGGLGVGLGDVNWIETEVNVDQDPFIALEALIGELLETALEQTLGASLGGDGNLISVPLPVIDLSGAVGLPPGSAIIRIEPGSVERIDGFTVIGASL